MRTMIKTSVLLTTTALAFGACGGDDTLSKAEYVKQANKICRDSNAKLEKLTAPTEASQLADYVADAKKITTSAVDEMDALKPPESLQADHDAHIANGRKVIAMADDLAKAAESGDEAEMQKVSEQGDKLDEESDKLATKMGLTDCADDGS